MLFKFFIFEVNTASFPIPHSYKNSLVRKYLISYLLNSGSLQLTIAILIQWFFVHWAIIKFKSNMKWRILFIIIIFSRFFYIIPHLSLPVIAQSLTKANRKQTLQKLFDIDLRAAKCLQLISLEATRIIRHLMHSVVKLVFCARAGSFEKLLNFSFTLS